jgi:SAM-dependent methyltransferase
MKLNLGCGNDVHAGAVNHDIVKLPGVDVVHDLTQRPWPWKDGEFDEIFMKDVLEHIPETIPTIEEIYRISQPGAKVTIAIPYWNSWEAITDPTHKVFFNEYTFEFFDPGKKRCQRRPYYTHARFKILKIGYVIKPFGPVFDIPILGKHRTVFNPLLTTILRIFASYFNNVIVGLDLYLERV